MAAMCGSQSASQSLEAIHDGYPVVEVQDDVLPRGMASVPTAALCQLIPLDPRSRSFY
jgi:hypothetical protein